MFQQPGGPASPTRFFALTTADREAMNSRGTAPKARLARHRPEWVAPWTLPQLFLAWLEV